MNFTKDSGLVKVWVGLVMVGVYKMEQVPKLFNLKEVVNGIISGTTE
ncbi:hypothetical protein OB446_024365 [Paenibacillus alvei]|nr:hypothetical protein [Paenibacillus alvei]EJW14851.1 hypothetical protein PAV_11c01920 [Paenibacillus alvei DSM 29]MCY9708553.1 hypothetical protein [Paenibacillus alvei]MEC0083254.1 hypothetical protein [Paenibacillus alvei]